MAIEKRLTVMVSSTVYHSEHIISKVCATLESYGYEVWNSHEGTLQVFSNRTAFDNCLAGVEDCDIFLGLIFPWYGSGKQPGQLSITHQEFLKAIQLKKPRWFMVHDHVVYARDLLRALKHDTLEKRAALTLEKGAPGAFDLRLIDLYETAILANVSVMKDRHGNWAQKVVEDDDVLRYATAQFHAYDKIEAFVRRNFEQRDQVAALIGRDAPKS